MKNIFIFLILIISLHYFGQSKIIKCDSIYQEKGYEVVLKNIKNADDENDSKNNVVFTFYRVQNNKKVITYQEPLYSHFKNIEFEDFNGDGIKDVLVENFSDVRSNLTYNLFLVNLKKNKLTKIIGFDDIKNPKYLKKYNLISNLVMSGKNWTSFYKIENNKVKDFGYTIEDDGNGNYDAEYKRILSKIIKSEKKRKK